MKYFLSIAFLFLYVLSYSQPIASNVDSFNFFDKLKKKVIEFETLPVKEVRPFDFSNIKIIDKRYDTTAIGYIMPVTRKTDCIKLVTKNSLNSDLETFLNNTYQKSFSSNNSSLIIVLRRFWIYKNYDYDQQLSYSNGKHISYAINLSFDCFLFSNNLGKALMRKDTIIKIYKKSIDQEEGVIAGQAIQGVLNSLPALNNTSVVSAKRGYTIDEINENYNKNFHKAILTDGHLNRGVYMSLNEFKNNSPSYTNFDVKKTKLADDIYLIEGKDSIPTQKAWGYCDGKKCYMKMGGNLFQLNKQDKSFSLMGNKGLTHEVNKPGNFYNDEYSPVVNLGAVGLQQLLFSKDKFKSELFPMQLDIETGEVY